MTEQSILSGEFRDPRAERDYRISSYAVNARQIRLLAILILLASVPLSTVDYLSAPSSMANDVLAILRILGLAFPILWLVATAREWPYRTLDRLVFGYILFMILDSVMMVAVFREDIIVVAARIPLYVMIANVMLSMPADFRALMNLIGLPCIAGAFWVFPDLSQDAAVAMTMVLAIAFSFGYVAGSWLGRFRRAEYARKAELENANQALVASHRQIEEASRSKALFLSNVSHELRTPLNAIIGFSEMLSMQLHGPIGSPKYREYVGDIRNSGNHLLDLINDLLDLNRLEAGKAHMEPDWLDVAEVAAECRKVVLAAHRYVDAGRLEIEGPPDLQVHFDRRALHQILVNLTTNAVKYAGETALVRITFDTRRNGSAAIAVRDDGSGMDQRTLERLMRPFEQADSVTARKADGWGLGLPLANALAQANGSELSIESRPGEGTRVRLSIPRAQVRVLPDQPETELARSA